jgi:hypothetical protein
MSFTFHVEVVPVAGKVHHAATADAKPNHPVTAQSVNVDPKSAFDRRVSAVSSAAKSAHVLMLRFSEIY